MVVKSFVLVSVLFTLRSNGAKLSYTYVDRAKGWLKLTDVPTNWDDAMFWCDLEDTVLASPVTVELREAIKDFLSAIGNTDSTIFTGLKADFSTGDYVTAEGIHVSKLPLTFMSNNVTGYESSTSCFAWATGNDTVLRVKCSDNLPYVCYKKRRNTKYITCGTNDTAYNLNSITGSCYKFHKVGNTWSDAYMTCNAEGGYLAVINSKVEAKVLKDLFVYDIETAYQDEYPLRAFVGIRDRTFGDFEFTTEGSKSIKEAGFDRWHPGRPTRAKPFYCVTITLAFGDLLDDRCDFKYTFICEKKPQVLE